MAARHCVVPAYGPRSVPASVSFWATGAGPGGAGLAASCSDYWPASGRRSRS